MITVLPLDFLSLFTFPEGSSGQLIFPASYPVCSNPELLILRGSKSDCVLRSTQLSIHPILFFYRIKLFLDFALERGLTFSV